MLKAEAAWLRDRLEGFGAEDAPLLNVGASSSEFRIRQQPWIETLVFEPLRQRGLPLFHQDLEGVPGIDISGDLMESECQASIRAHGIRSILCSNVLEHVPNPAGFAQTLYDLLPVGGRLLVTVPHAFPFHPDPIDTLFRPTPDELLSIFPSMQVLDARKVVCGRLHNLVFDNPARLLRAFFAGNTHPRAESPRNMQRRLSWIPWAFKPFQVSCVEFVKRS